MKLPIAASYVARHASAGARLPAGQGGQRRFIDWVIEVDTVRGWRCIRSFRDIGECRAFIVAPPYGDNVEFLAS